MSCPCGSENTFETCCGPVLEGARTAATAEELMRARYTAYTRSAMDFLTASLHPDTREGNDAESARDWAEKSEWHDLEIIETVAGGPDDETGTVEFAAVYTYEGERQRYHEVGSFAKAEGVWYFTAGRPGVQKPIVRAEPKIGRNEPCPCGSDRKYKRCCGA